LFDACPSDSSLSTNDICIMIITVIMIIIIIIVVIVILIVGPNNAAADFYVHVRHVNSAQFMPDSF